MEVTEEETQRIQQKIEKLRQSKFKQQMLPAFRPIPSFGSTMIIFAIFGILFITVGATLYAMSSSLVDIMMEYDNLCGTPHLPPFKDRVNPNECFMEINVPEDLPGPVFIYY